MGRPARLSAPTKDRRLLHQEMCQRISYQYPVPPAPVLILSLDRAAVRLLPRARSRWLFLKRIELLVEDEVLAVAAQLAYHGCPAPFSLAFSTLPVPSQPNRRRRSSSSSFIPLQPHSRHTLIIPSRTRRNARAARPALLCSAAPDDLNSNLDSRSRASLRLLATRTFLGP